MKSIGFKLICVLALSFSMAYGYTTPVEGGSSVTVTNSWVEDGFIHVGSNSSFNVLNVVSGGDVLADEIILGGDYVVPTFGSDNLLMVSGSGVTVEGTSGITVGDTGSNNQLILLGGATAVGDGYIGYEETANNNGVVVSGSGSTWTADYIGIGEVGSDNYVTVSNNGLINSFSITVGTSDNANNTLTVGDGGIVSAEDLTIESGGSAQVWAGGRLNVLYVFGNLSIAGIFAPGVTTGSSELNGSLNLSPSASLEMEIGGLGGVNSDHLEVTGSATLGGELKVILAGGFNPAIDDTFDLLDLAGGVSGTFDSINLPALGGEKSWDTTLLYTEGKLSVVFGPADLDGNGIADAWEQAYFGGTVDPDGNPDNDVQNNLQEYIAGTDPTNSASYFQVSQSGYDDVAGGYVLQWPVVSNRYYTVSWRDDLVFGTSSNLLENAELPQNSYTDTVHSAGNQRFYSVDVRTK